MAGRPRLLGIAFLLGVAVLGPAAAGERQVLAPAAAYPEGALVHQGALYYAEMTAGRVTRWTEAGTEVFWQDDACGPTSLAPFGGGFLVLCHLDNRLVRLSATGEPLGVLDTLVDGSRVTLPNDSIADGRGGVYVSSSGPFSTRAWNEGAILHVGADGFVRRVADEIHYANGLAMAEAGRALLVSEHLGRRVLRYEVAEDGSLGDRSVFVELDDIAPAVPDAYALAGPDGLEVDSDGNVYVCEYGAGRILIVSPQGALLEIIDLPERFVTNIALAPGEGALYVTAPASNSDWPYEGRVYRLPNPVR